MLRVARILMKRSQVAGSGKLRFFGSHFDESGRTKVRRSPAVQIQAATESQTQVADPGAGYGDGDEA